jgi:twitching motility two-component system response regulator PilH
MGADMTTVLVVEDLDSARALISSYLRKRGYNVIEANNGKEALHKSLDRKPDLIITDVVMPEMNGFELCRFLKKNPNTKNLPIVICTSKNQEIDRLWGIKQGAKAYITKPFTEEEIIEAVEAAMS